MKVVFIANIRFIKSAIHFLVFPGKGDEFPGLVPLIRKYLDGADVDVDTRCSISQYLSFIQVG